MKNEKRIGVNQGDTMKRYVWLAALVAGGVNLGVAQAAQETTKTEAATEEMGSEMVQEAAPWRISGGLVYKNWLYEHDGLQQRLPTTADHGNDWENGKTSGNGWGLQARIGRGEGWLDVSFIKSDFDYRFSPEGGYHQIDTVSRDFEVLWSQVRGHNDLAQWGSTLGFRYLGMQKHVQITEGTRPYKGDGNMTWLMLVGGYNGDWRPFDTPTFQIHGSLLFFLGEADGTARSGSDESWTDGVISETYDKQYSLAYGARGLFGADIAITKEVRMTIDYMREWLYSFDATDTGIVVFPDNSDALFIENHHAVVASLNYIF
jgi:hypothetical protein